MVEIFFGITALTVAIEFGIFLFLVKHINSVKNMFTGYQNSINKDSEIQTTIELYQETVLELEEKNKKLGLENRLLQEKIGKINNQMKQISEHFKTN